jgi:mono/diheme cytochrome c family protein
MAIALMCAASAAPAFTGGEPKSDKARQLFLDACTACHTLERVKAQRLTADEWRGVTAGMISEGIALTDDEITLVVEYLAENFGPENP